MRIYVLVETVVIGQNCKLKDDRFRLEIIFKKLSRVVKYWNRLPREVAGALSPRVFKVRLDGGQSNLIQLKMSLFIAGGWTR